MLTVERNCAWCGKKFPAPVIEIKRNWGKFCSRRCSFCALQQSLPGRRFTPEQIAKYSKARMGSKNPSWKGGLLQRQGYWVRRINGKYVPVHRLIAEKAIGRKLKPTEIIHHVNCDRLDNRHQNLLICTHGYHSWLHEEMARRYAAEHFIFPYLERNDPGG